MDAELILPKLVLCLGFWIRKLRGHSAKVGILSGVLDPKLQSSSAKVRTFSVFLDTKMQRAP